MEELAKYIPVHNYGKCLKNKDEPDMGGRKGDRAGNKQAVLQRYKFYLAFENNKIKDYVSEKVFDGLLGGTLPVYYGAESIEQFMPVEGQKAVIQMDDFESMENLAAFLNELARDRIRAVSTPRAARYAFLMPTPPNESRSPNVRTLIRF